MSNTIPAGNPSARRKGLTLIATALVLAGLGWGTWHALHGRHHESTDNAYVAGNVVQITPQVGGTVVAVHADESDLVRRGQVLVTLDATDAHVALEQAEAQLAQTVREVRTLFVNNSTLKAQLGAREADVARMQTDVSRLQDDVNRRAPLVAPGAVGKEEFQHFTAQLAASRNALTAAQSALLAAREQLTASQTQTDGLTVEQHPQVQRAVARLREAHLAAQRVTLLAPLEGHVAKRMVQVGQRVQPGSPAMTVVALDQLWVDANFKESQLQHLRLGQAAELVADVYGDQVTFHGKVVGLGAGTGAAFALLPAQNATGNWIKIVQRVPVRIALDPKEVAAHPLRVGLSMEVVVNTADESGKSLADAPRTSPVAQTEVYAVQEKAADQAVQRVLAMALGRKPAPVAPAASAAVSAAQPAASAAR